MTIERRKDNRELRHKRLMPNMLCQDASPVGPWILAVIVVVGLVWANWMGYL